MKICRFFIIEMMVLSLLVSIYDPRATWVRVTTDTILFLLILFPTIAVAAAIMTWVVYKLGYFNPHNSIPVAKALDNCQQNKVS